MLDAQVQRLDRGISDNLIDKAVKPGIPVQRIMPSSA